MPVPPRPGLPIAAVAALLAGGLAMAVDASGPAAQLLVARCARGAWNASLAPGAWLDHVVAYPWTTAWMLLACRPAAEGLRSPARAAGRVLLMLLAMLPACAAARGVVAAWPGPLDALAYAGVMVLLGMAAPLAARPLACLAQAFLSNPSTESLHP